MSAAHELIQLVDEKNRPCGAALRSYARKLKLWHRASYIFVRRNDGKLCVQTRTMTKDIYPGSYDLCAGGVVDAGEAMHIGARRELAEELGVTGVPLTSCFTQRFTDNDLRIFGGVYLVDYSGKLTLQASEVATVDWYTPAEALALTPVTPDSHMALKRLLEEGWL